MNKRYSKYGYETTKTHIKQFFQGIYYITCAVDITLEVIKLYFIENIAVFPHS